nr:g-type lectin s-receptor-like serine/threonine-protein kinase [Quercus suber]
MHERRRYLELADPRLEGGVASEEVEKLVRIALCCVHQDPALRPTMANVVGMLEGELPLGEPRVESLNFLRAYGQRFTETATMEGPSSNGATIATHNSLSYISSQQISGPSLHFHPLNQPPISQPPTSNSSTTVALSCALKMLSQTGNLVLVDAGNNTLWESFDHPTDTIVVGQRIPIGKSLQSAVSYDDMSVGDYRLEVTDRDMELQWNKMNYWKLSMDPEVVRNSNKAVLLMVMNGTGSFILTDHNKERLGYVKVLVGSSHGNPFGSNKNQKHNFPIAGLVLLPLTGFLILIAFVIIAILWLRKNRLSKTKTVKPGQSNSLLSAELEMISIPGFPRRFDYEELAAATENFKNQIGRGGFGIVYKGTLTNQTIVVVKKITSSGIQVKKEFYSEISIIWNICHVNLVRLTGFCAQGKQRFLVLEYMNRGSLDSTLFGDEMHVRRRYLELADPRLEGGVSSEEIEKLVRIALCCLHQDPALRLTMANVVGMLEGGLALSEPRVKSLNFLRAYGQRFTETATMQGPTSNGATIATYNSLSYISPQQLSGPR